MRCLGWSGSRKNFRQSLRSFGALIGTFYMYHLQYAASIKLCDYRSWYGYNTLPEWIFVTFYGGRKRDCPDNART